MPLFRKKKKVPEQNENAKSKKGEGQTKKKRFWKKKSSMKQTSKTPNPPQVLDPDNNGDQMSQASSNSRPSSLFEDARVRRHVEDPLRDTNDSEYDSVSDEGQDTTPAVDNEDNKNGEVNKSAQIVKACVKADLIGSVEEKENDSDESEKEQIAFLDKSDEEDDEFSLTKLKLEQAVSAFGDGSAVHGDQEDNQGENIPDRFDKFYDRPSSKKTLRPTRQPLMRRMSGSIPRKYVKNPGNFPQKSNSPGFQPSAGFSPTGYQVAGLESDENANENQDAEEAQQAEESYASIPTLEIDRLPRGGISIETEAVGRIQFGIPPETIKDSMIMGLDVPTIYILPLERFCREMGPALGINLAEFEFPAYYNFFIRRRKCQLVVDKEVETNIRRVFNETLLGPAQFRRDIDPIPYEEEDFTPDFPRNAIPNFYNELKHFRTMPGGKELNLETLIEFCHFTDSKIKLGVPPPLEKKQEEKVEVKLKTANGHSNNAPAQVVSAAIEGRLEPDNYQSEQPKLWTYAMTKTIQSVARVYPSDANPAEAKNGKGKRVEIFKEKDGTLYILHDINEDNIIVGKVKFSGHVRVSESMVVHGFESFDSIGMEAHRRGSLESGQISLGAPIQSLSTFHPPSFGVTVLGNSHGFDEKGSTSGYVLWVNGRGIMIDPPPYSSATLEREGIRRRTIVGIILTHCHADHDAGAFQKVLSGSPVVVITTPTIYKSFIRKYAALSALSPALLRHSHRHKAAIIGEPLRFQGATFYFTYTLHTIPCISFRVEWRGRSMVFTGDHFNSPSGLDKLQEEGILTQERADDLRKLPLQDTDLLLHESGAPPIHTPLDALLKLPQKVKDRLYVVHTSQLPPDCELRVAPTGTAGTIRLDDKRLGGLYSTPLSTEHVINSIAKEDSHFNEYRSSASRYSEQNFSHHRRETFKRSGKKSHLQFSFTAGSKRPDLPLVAMRPTSSTDAWFILNLLSAVPFLSSLSYAHTMEVLEIAKVDTYYQGDIVVPASRRKTVLCVIWEGTCVEHHHQSFLNKIQEPAPESTHKKTKMSIWHAGDWTGPRALQPEKKLSGESSTSEIQDIVAMSSEGVKVITIEFAFLHIILKEGSTLYRKYLERKKMSRRRDSELSEAEESEETEALRSEAVRNLNVMELLDCNSALRKLSAVQKRHLESLAEGPLYFPPGKRLWRSGAPVEQAFIVVKGTVSFVTKRANRMSTHLSSWRSTDSGPIINQGTQNDQEKDEITTSANLLSISLADAIARDAEKAMDKDYNSDNSSISTNESHSNENDQETYDMSDEDENDEQLTKLNSIKNSFKKRANLLSIPGALTTEASSDSSSGLEMTSDSSLGASTSDSSSVAEMNKRQVARRRSSRDRFANKILGNSAYLTTTGLVFSKGHFLGDVSKMVAKRLSSSKKEEEFRDDYDYGYGGGNREDMQMVIHEKEDDKIVVHDTSLLAGNGGSVVLSFPKSSLITFLDEYPGLLLSLLGTQVVV